MRLDTLFQRLRSRIDSRSQVARRKRAKSRGRVRPSLEALEVRWTPSTVTNLADSGAGSLRDAIVATPAGGVIDFQPGLTGVINLTSGELVIDHSLSISGPGAGSLTISAGNASRVLDVTKAGANVSLSGLTLANGTITGSSGFGGGISNLGSLAISNCTITNNFAQFGGGGIENYGTLSVSGSTLSGNATTAGLGSGGGAIYNSHSLTVSNCTFSGNLSEQGGGIINNGGTLVVDSSTFSQNHGGAGGGIFSVFQTATATVTNSTFAGNFADTAAGYVGGGIANTAGTLTVAGCTFSGNSAGTAVISGGGGAIYNQDGHISVSDSTLTANSAAYGGGIDNHYSVSATVANLNNSTVSGNSGTTGGGLSNDPNSVFSIRDTLLAGNTATTATPDVNGTLASQGHNLIGNGTGGGGYAATDLVGTSAAPIDPKLGALQNNGGATATMALLTGSPAIDAGDNTAAPAFDQRGAGFARIVNGTIDIGAFEVQTPTTAVTPTVTVNPVNISYGTPLDNAQLSGTATATVNGQGVNVAGSFAYTTAAGTVLNPGNGQAEQVTFTPADTTQFTSVLTSVTVNVSAPAPTLTVPANQTVEAVSAAGAPDLGAFTATASSVAGTPVISYAIGTTPISCSYVFPLGLTPVTVTATDSLGQSTSGNFTVTVQDTTAPTLRLPPNQTVVAASAAGATDPAAFTATATDAVTASPTITYAVGTTAISSNYVFPLGTTTVNVTAADGAGNTSSGSFTVTVQNPSPTLPTLQGVEDRILTEVARFTVADKTVTPSSFTASVNWGDGQSSRAVVTGSKGSFQVTGRHSYAEEGIYNVVVSLKQGNSVSTQTGTVVVQEPSLPAKGGPAVSHGVDGRTPAANNGPLVIGGSHTNAEPGNSTVQVALTDGSGTAISTAGSASGASQSNQTPADPPREQSPLPGSTGKIADAAPAAAVTDSGTPSSSSTRRGS